MAGFLNTLLATFAIVLFSGHHFVLGQNQRAVLYDQYNGNGDYIVISERYVENLDDEGFDDRTRSVCVTGIWLFYQNNGFNTQGVSGVEYVFGQNYCITLPILAGRVSSIRYAGNSKDYRTDSLTLYQFEYFQGQEEYTLSQLPDLNLIGNHQSIIITGNSYWTLYDRPNYSGSAICLKVPDPGSSIPSFISDLQSANPAIPHGSIRSVRKGCSKQNYNGTVTLSSFAQMETAFKPTQLV